MAVPEARRRIAGTCGLLLVACAPLAGVHSALAQSDAAASAPALANTPRRPDVPQIRAGEPLTQALESLRAAGLDLLYSSQLVRPDMRVGEEPRSRSLPAVLAEILLPHGLQARPLGEGRFVVVHHAPEAVAQSPTAAATGIGSHTLEEVLVHASRYEWRREDVASTTLNRQRLDSIPGVEQDVIRAIQRIPGSAASGLSALSHVRGGYEDEVLIRFDGLRLYEPFHMKDFLNLFGVVDPELIETADIFSGGFPVEFGDRAGGVLDIVPRRTHGAEHMIGVSVINSRAISSGSHSQERGHWLAGIRRSNLTPVLRQLDRDVGEPQFEDVLARYDYRITPELTAAVGFLALEDDHEVFTEDRDEQATVGYSDDAVWLRADYVRDGWALGLHAAHSHLSTQRSGTAVREGVSSGTLTESRISTMDDVRLQFSYPSTPRLLWRGGVDFSRSKAAYGYAADATFEPPLADAFGRAPTLSRRFEGRADGRSFGPWVSTRMESGPAVMELGLRYDERTWLDVAGQWSPRASLRFDLDDRTVLRASAGRFLQTQSINELETENPEPRFAAPESSRHLILGLQRELPAAMSLRVEAFRRDTHGVRERFESLLNPLVLLPEIEVDRVAVAPSSSTSSGLEVTLQGDPQRQLNWWLSYTWSRAEDEFADGDAPRSWDQRQAALAGAAWKSDRWLLSAIAGYVSGWPFTSLQFAADSAALGARNREHFPQRLFLDVRAQYSLPIGIGRLECVAEVRNLLGQGNDCCRDIEVASLPGGGFATRLDQEKWLGPLPIVGVNWRF